MSRNDGSDRPPEASDTGRRTAAPDLGSRLAASELAATERLREIAIRFDEMLEPPRFRRLLTEQLADWCTAQKQRTECAQASPDRRPRKINYLAEIFAVPARRLDLREAVALLAAIHAEYSQGEALKPSAQPAEDAEALRFETPWAVLRSKVRDHEWRATTQPKEDFPTGATPEPFVFPERQILDALEDAQNHLKQRSECRANDTFTEVIWFGERFTFSKGQQAQTVRMLWKAWGRGTPRLANDVILEAVAESTTEKRVRDIFKARGKMHPAWNQMLRATGDGHLDLIVPDDMS